MNEPRLRAALKTALAGLLQARRPEGYWEGRLSSSALSTATAMSALALAGGRTDAAALRSGARWLAQTQNADGGWGDTPESPSNISTTFLCVAALKLCGDAASAATGTASRAEAYLTTHAGASVAERRAALLAAYGRDRTFAVPILMNCALAGTMPWEGIPPLPYELAVFPHSWYRLLHLHVVSYALPALIAVGLCVHGHQPPRNLFTRLLRRACTRTALARLGRIQPENGGFLEAIPLTSFVAMSLLPRYGPEQPVVAKCLDFIRRSARSDGSWAIDTNLSVWLTTASVAALDSAGSLDALAAAQTRQWLAARQYRRVHPYTAAAPGGWAWTHLPGGVPDVDDTAGALLALVKLGEQGPALRDGLAWLLRLQNADGGWPTFCRGWGKLPFDQSSPDLTAHALRAVRACDPDGRNPACARASRAGLRFLEATQGPEGDWKPLWFGNPWAPEQANPVLGTARVLRALAEIATNRPVTRQAVGYLVRAQHHEGGWGGAPGVHWTVEETALAVSALAPFGDDPPARSAAEKGAEFLAACVEDGAWVRTAPIGLYFARLWYAEELYPRLWTVEALGRILAPGRPGPARAAGLRPTLAATERER